MKIAVLGTGMVGKTLAGKLVTLGHDVALGTRDPAATLARSDPGPSGEAPMAAWVDANPNARVATFADAADSAEMVIVATKGNVTLAVLEQAGEARLDGKVVVDVSNPLDFSKGMPPTLFVSNDDSLGEQIQRRFPKARVVKSLNSVSAALMVEPAQLADGAHTMFVSGNDADAKAAVTTLLTEGFGWSDVIDLGDITTARGTEQLLPLWVRLWGKLQDTNFAFSIVRTKKS